MCIRDSTNATLAMYQLEGDSHGFDSDSWRRDVSTQYEMPTLQWSDSIEMFVEAGLECGHMVLLCTNEN